MQPEYELVAKQWNGQKRSSDDEHFFAVLDFQDGQQVYQRVSERGLGASCPDVIAETSSFL